MSHPLFERHKALLDQALAALAARGYWSAFPESPSPKVYGEGAAEAGKSAFDALLNKPFPMQLPGSVGTVGGEKSPYGMALGVTYPKVDLDQLFAAIAKAGPAWRKAGPEAWVGVSLEILTRINKRSFEIAHAVMHTTGQAFVMSFQAGCPHAQDRALEAIAYAWDELRRIPAKAYWEKPQGKNEPLKMEKALSHRAARRGAGDRLQHLPDVEWLSGHVREPRDRQCGDRQAASERHPAARDHRSDCARGAGRERLRPQRRDPSCACCRRRHGAGARPASGSEAN